MPRKNADKSSPSIQNSADARLKHDGLSFSFDAGTAPWTYHIAIGSARSDVFVGGDARDYLWGMGGNDSLAGGTQDDNLFGGEGNDVITGGVDADMLMGGSGNDQLYGGMDSDGLMGGEGDDYLDEGQGHGDLDGGAGDDTLVGGRGADAFMIMPGNGNDVIRDFTAGPGMFDHLAIKDLHWSDLSFMELVEGVKISFTGGSALLQGVFLRDLAQDDFMFANAPELPPGARPPSGPAPERPSPSTDGPTFGPSEEPGASFENFADAKMRHGDSFAFTFTGEEAYQVNVGTMSADSMQGGDTWDEFFGRDGNDHLAGNRGNDILQGDAGDDVLVGGAGRDRLDGGPGNDHLSGGDEEDNLEGGDGDDFLDAGAEHDMLNGGKGDDTYVGGSGADAFMVMPDSGKDIVLDFEATGPAQGAFDHVAFIDIFPNQVTVVDTNNGALITWDVNADGAADGSILLKDVPVADLRQSDFMFDTEPGFVAGVSTVGSYYIFP